MWRQNCPPRSIKEHIKINNNNNNGEFLYSAHTMLCALHTYTPGHWTCSFMYHFNSLFGAYSTCSHLGARTSRTHCHLCPTRYSFTPESSEACEGKVSCPRTQQRNNVPIWRGEKHDISLKILHQAGFETARQAATSLSIDDQYVKERMSKTYQ